MSKIEQSKQDMRPLTADEIDAVGGAGLFTNTGCIIISASLPMPATNPWLDPTSPQRRFG